MGVPLLHPWANPLAGFSYPVAGTDVELPGDTPLLIAIPRPPDPWGAPALLRWDVLGGGRRGRRASLRARLPWDRRTRRSDLPVPHRLEYRAGLPLRAVEIAVGLTPTEDGPVPVSFGFHPYLRIPGGSRADARLSLPVRRRWFTTAR